MGLFSWIAKRSATEPTQNPRRKAPVIAIRADGAPSAANMGRLESSWSATPHTADAYIYMHWQTLVARSRTGCEDYDHLRKYLQLVRDNVAGPEGFTLHSQPKDPSGNVDHLAAKAIEAAWKEWSEMGNCESSGTMSRADMERLGVTERAKDGELIGIKRYGKDAGPWGFSIQLIDPVLLDNRHYVKLQNGNYIRHGIEFNDAGRRVAYYFREFDEMMMGYVQFDRGAMNYKRVDAKDVLHWFIPEIIGQKRGLPSTRTALWRMRMLSGFEDAALVNARVGAAKMGFFKDPDADDIDEDGLPMDADPGTFANIGNRDFIPWQSQFPNNETEAFTRNGLRSSASGLGVSYNNLASDLTSVNFSSIRQGALDEREMWKGEQFSFVCQWLYPLFKSWLEYSLLAQKILVNGKPLKWERFEKYKTVAFSGHRWAWIDPQADMQANMQAVTMGWKSPSSVIEEATGRDAEDVWEEIRQDKESMKRCGIEPPLPNVFIPPQSPETSAQAKSNQPE